MTTRSFSPPALWRCCPNVEPLRWSDPIVNNLDGNFQCQQEEATFPTPKKGIPFKWSNISHQTGKGKSSTQKYLWEGNNMVITCWVHGDHMLIVWWLQWLHHEKKDEYIMIWLIVWWLCDTYRQANLDWKLCSFWVPWSELLYMIMCCF